jgi:polyhydroxybutyrate depolymerase
VNAETWRCVQRCTVVAQAVRPHVPYPRPWLGALVGLGWIRGRSPARGVLGIPAVMASAAVCIIRCITETSLPPYLVSGIDIFPMQRGSIMTSRVLRRCYLFCVLCGVALLSASSLQANTIVYIDVGRGPVKVYIPTNYDPGTQTPLVMALHPYSWTGQGMETYDFQLEGPMDTHGYIYTHPDGRVNSLGQQFWDATDWCCDIVDPNTDEDVIYLMDVMNEIERLYNVDPKRIYIMGRSNGGSMAYRMACDHSEKIAAAISMAGPMYNSENADNNPANGEDYCQPTQPVHILHIHGTNDAVAWYGGGVTSFPDTILDGLEYPGAVESYETWSALNNCLPNARLGLGVFDLTQVIPGEETTATEFPVGCHVASSTVHWKVQYGPHNASPYSPPFYDKLFEYFAQHPKEEMNLADKDTITWPPIHVALEYRMYRGDVGDLTDMDEDGIPDQGYGDCVSDMDPNLMDTTFVDTEVPSPGEGFFYNFTYVDVVHPIGGGGQEGGLGKTGAGIVRPNFVPCP